MTAIHRFLLAAVMVAGLFASCSKELSEEAKPVIPGGTAEGTVEGNGGPCTNVSLLGLIAVGSPLADSNQLVTGINFTKTGSYSISTDTVNGVYFSKEGTVTTTGPIQLTLNGHGTPVAAGDFTFTVNFKGSLCTCLVSVYENAVANGADYFPITAGNNWGYMSSDPAAAADDTLRTFSTGQSFTVSGNAYSLFEGRTGFGTDSSLYRKGNGEYHELGDLDVGGLASNVVPGDYIFLKDNVPVGTEWESAEGDAFIGADTLKIKLKFAVTAKDTTVLLDNKIYKNVIVVRTTELVEQPPADFLGALTYDTWYAKGIGIINVLVPAPIYGFSITNYTVL